jgi:hypothetical protein
MSQKFQREDAALSWVKDILGVLLTPEGDFLILIIKILIQLLFRVAE